MPSLHVKSGPLAGHRIEVDGELLIGRQDADVVIDDNEVSRRHLIVRSAPGALELEDLGSKNGTFVDGQRIDAPTRVGNGALVRLGETVFEVGDVIEPAPDAHGPASPAPGRGDGRARRAISFLAGIPTGRYTKFLVIAAWVVVIGLSSRNSLNLTKVQKSDPADYLPSDAEATRARVEAVRFPAGRLSPAAVVYRRTGGLTGADRARVDSDRAGLGSVHGVGAVDQPLFSHDQTSAVVIARVTPGARSSIDSVKAIRKLVGHGGGGLVVEVTGQAGFSADAGNVLGSIDTTLLFATLGLVLVMLVTIYRSPIFWVVPLFAILFAETTARGLAYLLGKQGFTITGQAAGVMTVLVFGVGTDYALLLVARYREELGRHEDRHRAAFEAIREAGSAIVPSSLTVIAGLLCLELAKVKGTSGLGAIGAAAVVVALIAMLTLLPALLCLFGRPAFWPNIPRPGVAAAASSGSTWEKVAARVAAAPRRVWVTSLVPLAVMAIGLTDLNSALSSANGFRNSTDAVKGQRLVAQAFPPGVSAPDYVIVNDASRLAAVRSAVAHDPAVASQGPVQQSQQAARFEVILSHDPYGEPGFRDIGRLRTLIRQAGGRATLVGGPTAEARDLRTAQSRDNLLIIPVVLVLVLLILAALLRAVVVSLLLIATVVASFAATLGVASFAFHHVFHFAGMDPAIPLLSFVLLVALGVDYNIFLMTRVRAETLVHGTRAGVIRGLTSTGGVITSAGVVLAGTFCTLALLPLVSLTEIGLTIAFGALLDTFLVRSLLVPALALDIGPLTWWPSRLARKEEVGAVAESAG